MPSTTPRSRRVSTPPAPPRRGPSAPARLFPATAAVFSSMGFEVIDTLSLLRLDLSRASYRSDRKQAFRPPDRSGTTCGYRGAPLTTRRRQVDQAAFGTDWGNTTESLLRIRQATPRHTSRRLSANGEHSRVRHHRARSWSRLPATPRCRPRLPAARVWSGARARLLGLDAGARRTTAQWSTPAPTTSALSISTSAVGIPRSTTSTGDGAAILTSDRPGLERRSRHVRRIVSVASAAVSLALVVPWLDPARAQPAQPISLSLIDQTFTVGAGDTSRCRSRSRVTSPAASCRRRRPHASDDDEHDDHDDAPPATDAGPRSPRPATTSSTTTHDCRAGDVPPPPPVNGDVIVVAYPPLTSSRRSPTRSRERRRRSERRRADPQPHRSPQVDAARGDGAVRLDVDVPVAVGRHQR